MDEAGEEKQAAEQTPAEVSNSQPPVTPFGDSRPPKTLYERILDWLKNNRFIALAMVFAAGVAGTVALVENIEWIYIKPFVISNEASRTLYGRVYEFMDVQKPVSASNMKHQIWGQVL